MLVTVAGRIIRRCHPHQPVKRNVIMDALDGRRFCFVAFTRGAGEAEARKIAGGAVSLSVADLVLENFLALDPALAGVHSGAHDEEADLAVLVRNDLRVGGAVGGRVCRFDHPAVFLELFEKYMDAEGVDLLFGK